MKNTSRLALTIFSAALTLVAAALSLAPTAAAAAPFTFDNTGSLATAREDHTATLLPNGKVLVAGGGNSSFNALASAELYDPASGTWSATGSLATARYEHTATLLPNGKVLVAGGFGNSGLLASAELYDPTSGTWSATGSLATARQYHTATLLPSGKVLVAGGGGNSGALASAELYDPTSGTWTPTGSLATARYEHTATLLPNGKVLVAGGYDGGSLASAELYDPASGTWTITGSLGAARYEHTATLLPNGKVLVAGGVGTSSALASAELYDPASGTWTATGSLATARYYHTATLLPSGKVLVAAGRDSSGNSLASAELYDPASGTWSATSSLGAARYGHTATLLPNGKVLVAGGYGSSSLASAELYDPASGTWAPTGPLVTARFFHTATLLPNGKVLVAGGYNGGSLASAELYDPASGTWSATSSLATARYDHTATLLPNGKVLVAGGVGTSSLASAELYDPTSGSWTATGPLATARHYHTATLLPNGKVLVAGGFNSNSSFLASAELYDPASGTWTATSSLGAARYGHTATLLPNGKVLVAGGEDSSFNALASAELYDPASGTWTATGSLGAARDYLTATLLPNGNVLVAGGNNSSGSLASAELYDPASGTWSATGSIATARNSHRATLLPNGKVLVTGGFNGSSSLASSELYDIGLGFLRPDWQPQIATATSLLKSGSSLTLTGSRFQGISQASGGNFQDSSSNYPIVQLRSLESSQVAFLLVDPTAGWSDTAFTSKPVTGFPFGSALVTIFTNGIPSDTKYLVVADAAPTSLTYSTNPATYTKGTALTNNTPTSSGGAVVSYSISPALPTGLSFSTSTGVISGTPTELSAATNYTVTATNSGGFTTATVNITVNDVAPSALTYSTNPATYTKGTAITNNTPSSSGGAVVSYSILPALPTGLSFSTSTGVISGTPTALSAATDYTVTATNSGGSTTAIVNITVKNVAPSALTYSTNPATYTKGTAITNNSPSSSGGVVVSYSISPALPAGLSFSTSTGVISGTPTALSASTDYTVTATNSGGSTTATVNITVKDVAPSALTYSTNPATYTKGQLITDNTPLSSGGPVVSYSISATLPTGLSFSTSTGVISGTPTAVSAVTDYTVTATNSGGSTTATVNIRVNDVGLVGNVSTRLPVGTDDNVLIEGFIVQGPVGLTKKIIVRAIGPSLAAFGITDALANPVLEIHDASNLTIATNDNWRTTQVGGLIIGDQSAEISASGLAPGDDLESAIIANLAPGSYTAVVRGVGNTTGTGVVDAYDISAASPTRLANIATRGLIQAGDKLMIAGFIVQNGPVKAVICAIGPSLTAFGITNALADPTLQLRDQNGAIVLENDNWKTRPDGSSQQQEIENTGLQPTNDLESALVATIQPGQYTAQVRGNNQATGIGVVQVYFLQ